MSKRSSLHRSTAIALLATAVILSVGIGRASADHDVEHRIAQFWQRVDALGPADLLTAADLGQWALNVIERDPGAGLTVADFRVSTGAMQAAFDRAGVGIPPGVPKSADVETRIARFWAKVDALGTDGILSAADLGQWALNVTDRDPNKRIRVDDFRVSTAGMQAGFERARSLPDRPADPASPRIGATATGLVVTVTNTTDDVNGNTSTIGSLSGAAGPDGISFREALLAANGTPGWKTIRFAASVKNAEIQVQPPALPALTGGSLMIDGDIDGDGLPDVTLNGLQRTQGLVIRSSDITIARLRFIGFPDKAINFSCQDAECQPRTVSRIRIIGNVVVASQRSESIHISPHGLIPIEQISSLSGLAWEDIEITGNTLAAGPDGDSVIALRAGGNGSSRSTISRVLIAGNQISGGRVGVNLGASDETSHEHGGTGPIRYSDGNSIEDVTIKNNIVAGPRFQGIVLQAANAGNRDSRIARVLIDRNTIPRGPGFPIVLWAGEATETFGSDQARATSGNTITDVRIRSNAVEPIPGNFGVVVSAAGKPSSNRPAPVSGNSVLRVDVRDNSVVSEEPGATAIRVTGGAVYGPESVTGNVVSDVALVANRIIMRVAGSGTGIDITGGSIIAGDGTATGNQVRRIIVRDNAVTGAATAIALTGGRGGRATGNAVRGYAIVGSDLSATIAPNADGAVGNFVE